MDVDVVVDVDARQKTGSRGEARRGSRKVLAGWSVGTSSSLVLIGASSIVPF